MQQSSDVRTLEDLIPRGSSLSEVYKDLHARGLVPHSRAVTMFGPAAAWRMEAFRHLMRVKAEQHVAEVCCPAGCGPDSEEALSGYMHPIGDVEYLIDEVAEMGMEDLQEVFSVSSMADIFDAYANFIESKVECPGPCQRREVLLTVASACIRGYAAMSFELQRDSETNPLRVMILDEINKELDSEDLPEEVRWAMILSDPRLRMSLIPEHLQGSDWAWPEENELPAMTAGEISEKLTLPIKQVVRAMLSLASWLHELRNSAASGQTIRS